VTRGSQTRTQIQAAPDQATDICKD